MTEPGLHKLGEVLRTAREAKGVDLARVERDTKIRARYLSALERGEYRELPGPVYTKGFLRNYGLYLSLDPEYLIDLYRLEASSASAERPSVASPPRPIAVRRSRGFVLTPGLIVAAILTVLVFGIGAYLAGQLIAFAGTPELRVIDPPGSVAAYDGDSYTLRGVTSAGARVSVTGPRESPSVTAGADGVFEVMVLLLPGRNIVTLSAYDPTTGRTSATVQREITMATAIPSGSIPETPPLTLSEPADGAAASGTVTVSGAAAPGSGVSVTATSSGAPDATFQIVDAAGRSVAIPDTAPPGPAALELTADANGAFSGTFDLAPGSWQLSATDGTTTVERSVSIPVPAGLVGTLRMQGGASYMVVDEDGQAKQGASGDIVPAGGSVALTANRSIRIRAGNAGAVDVTINGIHIGLMGADAQVIEWRVARQ